MEKISEGVAEGILWKQGQAKLKIFSSQRFSHSSSKPLHFCAGLLVKRFPNKFGRGVKEGG